jgi:hypothetical protein
MIRNLAFLNSSSVYLNWQFDDNGDSPIAKVILESINLNGNSETFEKSLLIKLNFDETHLIYNLKRCNNNT